MNRILRSQVVWPLAVIGLCLPGLSISSQQTTQGNKVFDPYRTGRASAVSTHPINNALENDPRLLVKMSLSSETTTIARTLSALTRRTNVKLVAEGDEVGPTQISFHYHTTALKDILDSIAAVRRFEWERRDHGVLVLKEGYDPNRFNIPSHYEEEE